MKRTLSATATALTLGAIGLAAAPTASANPVSTVPIPKGFTTWIERAAERCEGLSPALIAAQIQSESDFRTNVVSPSDARGPSQFIPETWEIWGIDADRDGRRNPFSIADAVVTQAAFMCDNLRNTTAGVESGRLVGDPVDLALAAYNAGLGAVLRFGGMPSGGEYSTQTQPYVEKIRELERLFADILPPA